ncbi:MAG: MBL fold metallo-hydrolase [Candidatus Neomarinimicrobiota bacterium]
MNPEADFSIRPFLGGYDKNFTYLITCNQTRSNVIVDASLPSNQILPFVSNPPTALLITHTHSDHISYVNDYITIFPDLMIFGHSESASIFDTNNFKVIKNHQNFKIGRLLFKAIHTPGHYFDSICYLLKPAIFTGDTLFIGRTGRIKSKKSDIRELYNSIYKKLLVLSNELRIYPGHDYGKHPSLKIKDNISISPLLRAKNLQDFIERMKEYESNRLSDS